MERVNSNEEVGHPPEKKGGNHCFGKHTYDPEEVCLLTQKPPHSRDNSKVQVRPDKRDLQDLSSNFRHISIEVLTRVWESNNQSWDVCFDVLNAWLASHGPVLVCFKQLEFLLDGEEWPSLPCLHPCLLSPASSLPQLVVRLGHLTLARTSLSLSEASGSGASDGWSLCEVSEDERFSDIGENWVQVQVQEQGQEQEQEQGQEQQDDASCSGASTHSASACAPARPSFRDMLLSAPLSSLPASQCSKKRPRSGSGSGSGSSGPQRQQQRVWRPQIVCVRLTGTGSHQHRGVVYMDSAAMQNAPEWDQAYDSEEEEGECRGWGGSTVSGHAAPAKCFAQAALSNALRVRSAVRQANNQNVKALRCKY